MEVYVDELYSSCSSCPFFSDELLTCFASDDKELDFTFSKDFNRVLQRHPECPLQSLADHDKQVRKEVCDEVRDKMSHWESCLTKEIMEYVINKETLDKIEKGE